MHKIIVMGVSGCGKSAIGAGTARGLGIAFVDADDLHPEANVAKMSRGDPLNDEDRAPWLDRVGACLAESAPVVIACSALKRAYRDRIRRAAGGAVTFVHLAGDKALIAGRMAARSDHFMPTSLLDSQFAALEVPGAEERAISVDIAPPIDQVIKAALAELEAR